MTYFTFYRCLGETFPTPQEALSYARNMGLEGKVTMRAVLVRSSIVGHA
jgi:hypothetical protein